MIKNKIKFVRGDTYLISRLFEDKEGNPLIFNPETDDITFTVRTDVKSSEVLFTKNLSNGISVDEKGKYTITINPKDTEDLDFGKYGYDIEIRIGKNQENPFTKTVESGLMKLSPYDYTRHK